MPDGQAARQGFHHVRLGEVVADIAEAAGAVEPFVRIVGDDAARFLAPVLQGVQAQGHEIRRVGNPDHAEYPAFFLQLVVIERMAEERLHAQGAPTR